MASENTEQQARMNSKHPIPNPTELIYDTPARIPIADLLTPTLIKVKVWNETEDPTGARAEIFEIMRGVICARSEYFEKTFKGRFKEASEGTISLNDVSPWIFKVFLTWLYTGQVYIDHEDNRAETTHSKKRKLDQTVTPHDSSPRKMQKVQDGSEALGNTCPTQESDSYSPEFDGVMTGGDYTFYLRRETCIKSKQMADEKTDAPDEKDFLNPVTWPWSWLFDIYVFADQYDTKRLREQIMIFIQLRLDQRRPRMYHYPDQLDIMPYVELLPTTSPLRRLLVDLWAKNMILRTNKDSGAELQAKAMESLPQSFVIDCFLASKGALETQRCDTFLCISPSHDHAGASIMQLTNRCIYHEHYDPDNENASCEDLWGRLGEEYHVTDVPT